MNPLKFSLSPDTGRLSENDAKKYFSTFGIAACVLMLAYRVGSYLLSYALYFFAPAWLESALVGHLFSIVTLYGIAFPCFFLVISRLPKDTMASEPMGTKAWWKTLCVALAFMMIGNYIGNSSFGFIFA